MKKVLVVKIGNEDRPAGPKDIKKMKKLINKFKKGTIWEDHDAIITHHCVHMTAVDEDGNVSEIC